MDEAYIAKAHKSLLSMLEYIDSVCEKHNIAYSLDCGTLIGAVREKGFIPWDDDADIAITRKNYIKLMEVLDKEGLPTYLEMYRPENCDHFFDFTVRLYDTREIIRDTDSSKNRFNGFTQYPCIDFYVYDNLPDESLAKRIFILKEQIIFGLALSKRYKIDYKRYKGITKIYVAVLSYIGKLFNMKSICDMHKKTAESYMDKNTKKLYCTTWAPEYPGYQYDASDFIKYKKVDFENTRLNIVENYDNVLKVYYGSDYMIPIRTHDHVDFVTNY